MCAYVYYWLFCFYLTTKASTVFHSYLKLSQISKTKEFKIFGREDPLHSKYYYQCCNLIQTWSICPVYSGVSSYSPNVFGRPSKKHSNEDISSLTYHSVNYHLLPDIVKSGQLNSTVCLGKINATDKYKKTLHTKKTKTRHEKISSENSNELNFKIISALTLLVWWQEGHLACR